MMDSLDPTIDVEHGMTKTTVKFAAGPITGEVEWPRIADSKIAEKIEALATIYDEQNSEIVEAINDLAEEIDQ